MAFVNWDVANHTMLAGSIKRASSSESKVWGEQITEDVPYGCFVAFNEEGGCKPITSVADTVHGIVMRDIYADKAPAQRTANVGHFSHGDSVVAQAIEDHEFKRGGYVFIDVEEKGKITHVAEGNIPTAFVVDSISGDCVAITLGYVMASAAEADSQLAAKVTVLESDNAAQKTKVTALETSDKAQTTKITALETTSATHTTQIKTLQTDVKALQEA